MTFYTYQTKAAYLTLKEWHSRELSLMVMVVVVDDFEGGHLCTYFVLGINSRNGGYFVPNCEGGRVFIPSQFFYIEKVIKDFNNQYL